VISPRAVYSSIIKSECYPDDQDQY
jgi:hypothetical protein